MRFLLIDRIVDYQAGESIRAIKSLSLAEDYLQDHFPLFPVMPGVLMLESMTQTCAWYMRMAEEFAYSMVTLDEARNVKYANFVEPGQSLIVEAVLQKQEGRLYTFKAQGLVDDKVSVSARLRLTCYNRAELDGDYFAPLDAYCKQEMLQIFNLIYPPAARNQAATNGQAAGGQLLR